MSDWFATLEQRQGHLEAALTEMTEAEDQFLDGVDRDRIDAARSELEDVMSKTREELRLREADWRELETACESALDELVHIAMMLVDADLAAESAAHQTLVSPVGDEPDEDIKHLCAFINDAHSAFYGLRSDVSDMAEDASSSGGRY